MLGGATGIYPNLWNMAPGSIDVTDAIVGDGARAYGGIGGFAGQLTRGDTYKGSRTLRTH